MRLQDESSGNDNGRYSDTIYSDILAMLRLPLITPQMEDILNEFQNINHIN